MSNSEPIIQCSSPHCSATNDLKSRFCQRCKTPIIKRYLWAIGERLCSEGETDLDSEVTEPEILPTFRSQVVDRPETNLETAVDTKKTRYLVISDRIFLDTQPGETPQIPDLLPEEIVKYSQLFGYFPHIPQVYGQLDGTKTWLLDYGTVPLDSSGKLVYGDLLPSLDSLWEQANALKQVSWLRQIAGLWKPLEQQGMNASLIKPELVRVNGTLVQLLELAENGEFESSLEDLGQLWERWSQKARPEIRDVLIQLSDRMSTGSLDQIEEIIAILDFTLDVCSQNREYKTNILTISDSGPRRKNNQDHAYPDSPTPVDSANKDYSLAIVCDGVGGHEGGEIASQETVQYLSKRINSFTEEQQLTFPGTVLQQLVTLTNEANDALNERNDREQRQERQRMGTTLVMTLIHKHEVFLTHVGDSRIYLITPNSCHQITTDDDLASREVRLGYAIYRDALKYPSAGALIQALGMRHSNALHPNVKRLTLDEDCLFLLCTDGLSDFDRVEQYWRDVLVPVLEGKLDLTKAVKTLIRIGNERNGHDNVTAALVHFQVRPKPQNTELAITWSDIETRFENTPLLWTDVALGEDVFPSTESMQQEPTMDLDVSNDNTLIAGDTGIYAAASSPEKSPFFSIIAIIGGVFAITVGVLIYGYYQYAKDSLPNDNSPPPAVVSPDSDSELDRDE